MADDFTTDAQGAVPNKTFAADDIGGGKLVERVKVVWGVDGVMADASALSPLPVDTEIATVDLDTGAGTDSRGAVGLLLAASGGAQVAPGDATNGADVDVTRMPAAARTTDAISAALMSDAIMVLVGGVPTVLTPKYAKANIAASTTDGAVVTAVAGKKIRVLSFRLHAGATATNATFNSKPAGAGTAASELFACGANGGRGEQFHPAGHFETVSGEGLTLTTGAGSTVGVGIVYVEV